MEIFCDEAGHTGPDLLNKDQPVFAYASLAISDQEAWEIIESARALYSVQMPELKAANLLKSTKGCSLIRHIVAKVEGRFAVNVHDKLLSLCCWIFEYVFEPVYKRDPRLLYRKNLHRFVAMFTWIWLKSREGDSDRMIQEFQSYMRSRNPKDAPLLFQRVGMPLKDDGTDDPFELVLRFAYGYRHRIIADNASLDTTMPDAGRWVLDLSASGLWSHLNYWGRQGQPLRVRCDVSKPIQSIVSHFTGDSADPAIKRARIMGQSGPLGWQLEAPIEFVDSRDHPAIQVADVVAGTAAALVAKARPPNFEDVAASLDRHMLKDCVMPDFEVINRANREACVNFVMLYDLAKRAERDADPFYNLEEMYRQAEIGWVRGDFDAISREHRSGA